MLRKQPLFGDAKKELVMALLNNADVSQEAFSLLCTIVGVEDTNFISKYVEPTEDEEKEPSQQSQ